MKEGDKFFFLKLGRERHVTLWTGSRLNERQSKKAVTSNDDERKQRRISFELFFPLTEGYDVLMRTVFAFLCFVFDFVCFFFSFFLH